MLAPLQRAVISGPGVKRFSVPSCSPAPTEASRISLEGCSPVGNSCTGRGERKRRSWARATPPCPAWGCGWGAALPPAGFGEVAAVTGTPACLSASCFEQRGAPGENGQLSKPEFKEKAPRWRAAALGAGKAAPESPGCRLAEGEPPPPEPPAAGRASLPLLPRATTGNWPREQEQVLQKAPSLGFGRLRARRAAAGAGFRRSRARAPFPP